MLADISISGAVGATLALSGLAIFDVQIMVERDAPKFVGYVTGRRYSVNENSIAKTHGRTLFREIARDWLLQVDSTRNA